MKKVLTLIGMLLATTAFVYAQKLIYPYAFAPSEGFVNKTEKQFRSEICLNGYWDFQPVSLPQGYEQGKGVAPELPMPVDGAWDKTRIKIPSPWNINDFGYRGLEGPDHRNYPSYPKEWEQVKMAWMRKTVNIPSDWSGKEIKLHFDAVAGMSEVYVNGTKVGENFDLFLPFDLDVTHVVKAGEQAEVLVGVRSQSLYEDKSTVGRRVVPAGSMWGYLINGIWQDVFMVALPKVSVKDVYVKPLVSQGKLELVVTVENNTTARQTVKLGGSIREWLNKAGKDVNSAPVPNWDLGDIALDVKETVLQVAAQSVGTTTISLPVAEGVLKYWTPESPNLYALQLTAATQKGKLAVACDLKYERFGWREWTFQGTSQCLNGKPYPLKSDSWHFMGVPQMTRRYAYAWYTAIKGMNGNAVRLHAQVYPHLYMDMADEMGICILDETANWASDGGPKLDSETFFEHSRDHLRRFVERDRNHASVFGWSISNENKPVILYVFSRPDLLPRQKEEWGVWRDIVRASDPTRPWISSDGEDDGDGMLPVTVGHYGDMNAMRNWQKIGKPWGIGETGMCYYGTPEQVAKQNGERAYESAQGRMEGIANECYNLIKDMRDMGASYSTVFNMVWYGLKPLPLGKRDLTKAPTLDDGVFFVGYHEGVPGIQPERVGPYSTTFNPGYDPSLPLFETWPLYDALKAANAGDKAAPSQWSTIDKEQYVHHATTTLPEKQFQHVIFLGDANGKVKQVFDAQGVTFVEKVKKPAETLYIVDASTVSEANMSILGKAIRKGGTVWLWGVTPETVMDYNGVLHTSIELDQLKRSSFLPVNTSWTSGLNNSDFYFCELQNADAANYTLKGSFVETGVVLLQAAKTDWRKWNKRPEELKTAALLRSENECTAALPVFVKNGNIYVSTLTDFANSELGYKTLAAIIRNAGIPTHELDENPNELFFHRDDKIDFPVVSRDRLKAEGEGYGMDFYVYSNRPLDDLLIEPNVPKLTLHVRPAEGCKLFIEGVEYKNFQADGDHVRFNELPLKQGWNHLKLTIGKDKPNFDAYFKCDNRKEFLPTVKASLTRE